MKNKKDEPTMIIITPQKMRELRMSLKERTKVRERQAQRRRDQYFK